MEYNTVLFDLDGTLIDSLPLIKRTYKRVFEQMNIPWGQGDVMQWVGRALRDIGIHFAGADREEDFFKLYQHYYSLDHDRYTTAYPGTMEMLARLREQGIVMGVVTSKSTKVAQRSIDFLGMDKYMQVLIGAQDVDKHKPQPEPIFAALERLKRRPEQTMYVGDSPFDIMAAKAAGVKSVAVPWGIAKKESLLKHQPDLILDSWDDLL
ncbi:HAD-IA family hydrolase [Desulfofalx alkaliphila]|uniref:HAD-IA family hydrolase n=1 Tax=Desulfofalx alkaliphila TaxID=105483 RepID=UPI0004E1FBB8|nr:HAD-IA family hydrolase [Desulfofalx alkaliphila]